MQTLREQLTEIEADRCWWISKRASARTPQEEARADMMLREIESQIKELRERL